MNLQNKDKVLKTVQIILQALAAIAATWLIVSCTLSLSVSKNNSNSNQSTEQSSSSAMDSTSINLKK